MMLVAAAPRRPARSLPAETAAVERGRGRASASRSPGRGSGRRPASASSARSSSTPTTRRPSTTSAVALEQQGEFDKARAGLRQGARSCKPGDVYIQQNYDLFREADDKRNRKAKKKTPTPHALRRAACSPLAAAARLRAAAALRVEVPVETPLQSKLDVSRFRRVLVAGFVTDLGDDRRRPRRRRPSRLLQNQLRSNTQAAGARARPAAAAGRPREGAREARRGRQATRSRSASSTGSRPTALLQDAEFWRKMGEEYQNPLIVTGKLGFEEQNRSGFQSEERVVRDPGTNRAAARARQPLPGAQGLQPHRRLLLHRRQDRASSCTRRSSPRRSSTARTRRSRRSRPTSSSWTGCCRTSSG